MKKIEELLRKLIEKKKIEVIPQPPKPEFEIDVNGDLIIKKKKMTELPAAKFIVKKDLEIQRRELDDMTPIERILAPER